MGTTPEVATVQRKCNTAQLIAAMLKSHGHVSDLIFSPGRAPQVEVSGQLVELKFKGLESLTPQDTLHIASDLMGKNEHPIRKLEHEGSADLSYGVEGVGRFRVNIGKVFDARSDHRQNEHGKGLSHPDDRGSHRVSPQTQEGHDSPA